MYNVYKKESCLIGFLSISAALCLENHPTSLTVTVGNSKNIWFGNNVSDHCCQKTEYSAANLKNGRFANKSEEKFYSCEGCVVVVVG
jgi:hypothetical protein